MRRQLALLVVMTLAWWFVPPATAQACSCAAVTEAHSWGHADAVFTGTATREREVRRDRARDEARATRPPLIVTTFRVDGAQKGRPGETTTVSSDSSGASCGYDFRTGRRYHVYAHKDGEGGATYATGTCSGNHQLRTTAAAGTLPAVTRDVGWYLRTTRTTGRADGSFSYGPGGTAVFGDWDGDGEATPGWFDDGVWYLNDDNDGGSPDRVVRFGRPGDRPVVGDWDPQPYRITGTDLGVVRTTADGLQWRLETDTTDKGRATSDGDPNITFHYGRNGDVPVAGRWSIGDCRGCATSFQAGVVRRTDDGLTWLLETARDDQGRPTSNGRADIALTYGSRRDIPVTGDWDGDFITNVGVVRANQWLLDTDVRLTSSTRHVTSDRAHDISFGYGSASDQPAPWKAMR